MEQQQRTLLGAFCSAGLLAAATATLFLSWTGSTAYAARGRGYGPRPGTSATARSTPQPGATQRLCPAPVAGDLETGLLEGALGRVLTDVEKTTISAAATTRDASIQAALDTYRASVAAAVGLSAADLEAKIKSNGRGRRGDLNSILATALGRTLTVGEVSALQIAAEVRDAAVQAAVETYRTGVAAAVGLSVADLDAKVTAFLQTQRPGGRGDHGGGRGGGRGEHRDGPDDSGTGTGSY